MSLPNIPAKKTLPGVWDPNNPEWSDAENLEKLEKSLGKPWN